MNVKELLNEIPAKIREIVLLQDQVDQIKERSCMIGSLNNELIRHYNSKIRKLAAEVELSYQIINRVQTEKYRELLSIRFLSDQGRRARWKVIAKTMGFSISYVKGYLFRKAIAEATETYEKVR